MSKKDNAAKNSPLHTAYGHKSPADKFAVLVTRALGSITFLVICIGVIALWIVYNLHAKHPFDAFPFPILEMSVSVFAVFLSVSVLINQNRQGHMEKIREQVGFEVNVRAEQEVTKMLAMIHDIHRKLGIHTVNDAELEKMKQTTDVQQLHKSIDEQSKL